VTHRVNWAILVSAFLALSACMSAEVAPENASLSVPDTTSSITTGDMRIGPMDIVRVDVFGIEDLQGEYQVDYKGRIKMPLAGEIKARGYTAFELGRIIEEKLAETYLQDPEVSVVIEESVGQRVTVDGSVEKPGLFAMEGRMTLLQAVAQAGGPSDGANPKNVVIFRTVDGQRQAAAFNLEKIRKGKAEDPEVFGNDIVVVDGSEGRRIFTDLIRSSPLLLLLGRF
jgi:polysaccharide export outer membrane protein